MSTHLLHWRDMGIDELHDIYRLRAEVFVVEQNCPYQDIDGKDMKAYHLVQYEVDDLVAYLRILEEKDSEVWIGRVVTKQNWRGKKVGIKLMQEAIQFIRKKYPNTTIKISAQSHLMKYYGALGFEPYGEGYLEDNIPHHGMQLI